MWDRVCFFLSIAFALTAWSFVASRYVWPWLSARGRTEALRPILLLHSFRFAGLAFLIPGIVSANLPSAFAHAAALGDIVAAMLALVALLTEHRAWGALVAWLFNLWGFADILNAFVQAGRSGLLPGQLGAAYYLPTMIVPLLIVTHVLAFRILLRHRPRLHRHASSATHCASDITGSPKLRVDSF
jgi:hypothetical protein